MPGLHEFIRSSGSRRQRLKGGLPEGTGNWAGEGTYISADNAFRFCNHLSNLKLAQSESAQAVPIFALRRFLSDGKVARLEIGLKLSINTAFGQTISARNTMAILSDALQIPVTIKTAKDKPKHRSLIAAGDALAHHYLLATIDRRNVHPPVEPWWFSAGLPLLIVEYFEWDKMELPPHSRPVMMPGPDGVSVAFDGLSHCWLAIDGIPCSTWFLSKNHSPNAMERVRTLRIHLSRLHAEKECLRLVLKSIADGKLKFRKNSSSADALHDYLNQSLRLVDKSVRFDVQQQDILDAARYATGLAEDDASLKELRKQVMGKVEKYIMRAKENAQIINILPGATMISIKMGDVNVTGDFNMITASNIQGSFNKVASADAEPALKKQLKELSVKTAELAAELAKIQRTAEAEHVSADLHAFTSEALSTAPRKASLDITAKGLIDAAKFFATFATSIGIGVSEVFKLLGMIP